MMAAVGFVRACFQVKGCMLDTLLMQKRLELPCHADLVMN
jgi:hypothetical protein